MEIVFVIKGDTGEKGDKGPVGQGIDGPDGDQGLQGKCGEIIKSFHAPALSWRLSRDSAAW